MGIAAYNRGSRAIREQFDREAAERARARILREHGVKTTPVATFGPLTIRVDEKGRWWAMNHREKGWASFGYPFEFLGEALDYFGFVPSSFGTDEHGLFEVGVSLFHG